jgi:predicted amidohydrolase
MFHMDLEYRTSNVEHSGMGTSALHVALINEVFHSADAHDRLVRTLVAARNLGAHLALLPELPLDRWAPAEREARDQDAEAPGGPRHQALSGAARETGVAVIGGAIVRDPVTGCRHNTALVFDNRGTLVATYRKLHLPEEDGFWETSHYEHGTEPPGVIDGFAMPIGVQICSDSHRPEGSHLLAALGVEAIMVPRATEPSTFDRWRAVLWANARTTATYVVSVSRAEPDLRIPLGGPSIAIAPDGRVLVETTDPIAIATLDPEAAARARRSYPGYLQVRADVYARGWQEVARRQRRNAPSG